MIRILTKLCINPNSKANNSDNNDDDSDKNADNANDDVMYNNWIRKRQNTYLKNRHI